MKYRQTNAAPRATYAVPTNGKAPKRVSKAFEVYTQNLMRLVRSDYDAYETLRTISDDTIRGAIEQGTHTICCADGTLSVYVYIDGEAAELSWVRA